MPLGNCAFEMLHWTGSLVQKRYSPAALKNIYLDDIAPRSEEVSSFLHTGYNQGKMCARCSPNYIGNECLAFFVTMNGQKEVLGLFFYVQGLMLTCHQLGSITL